jgi:hypothetical protein
MEKINHPKNILKLSLKITLFMILSDLLIFFLIDKSKGNFILYSLIAAFILLFVFSFKLLDEIKTNLSDLKKESLYVNYPVRIMLFLLSISIILLGSAIYLVNINPSAASAAFIFSFFMTSICMMVPTIMLLVYMFFIVPAFVIPAIRKNKNILYLKVITILFFLLFIACFIYASFNRFDRTYNFYKQTEFKGSKLSLNYSTAYLQLSDRISPYAKKKMSRNIAKVPFFYLSEPIQYSNIFDADRFCRALGAKVPNYLEAYHIVFNRFDTFGDKYYWTSDKDGDIPLVLHFKNMSFVVERLPMNVKPELYCLITSEKDYEVRHKYTFHRDIHMENEDAIKTATNKKFNINLFKDITKMEYGNQNEISQNPSNGAVVAKEKKHVSFSVKEVSQDVLTQLIQQGYAYNPSDYIQKEYEINDATLVSKIRGNTNNIRLCYYPFVDYGNMGISKEKEIWQQSFCSPAFDLVSQEPVLKTRYEKDSYCYASGGRLPNIPELAGILKTLGVSQINKKYWVNTKVKDSITGSPMPISVYYKDLRFMAVEQAQEGSNEQAYVYCIKKPAVSSIVLANYKSRFPNESGSYYARIICPACKYYEVPDVILQH